MGPDPGDMDEQKRRAEALRSSLPVNVMDVIIRPLVSPADESAKAAIKTKGPMSVIIKQITHGKK